MSLQTVYSSSQYPSGADIFSYARDNLPKSLTLKELLTAIPAGRQVPLVELVERCRLTCDPHATEESVKDILYGEGIHAGLQVIPSFDGGLTIGHTLKSSSLYLDIGTVTLDRYNFLANRLILGTGEEKDDCGDVLAWKVCRADASHPRKPLIAHCDRLECPVCYTRVLVKAADRIAATTEGFKSAIIDHNVERTGKRGRIYAFRHFSFNPSEKVWHALVDKAFNQIIADGKADDMYRLLGPYFLKELRNAAHIWLEASGLKAYVIVPHFERIRDEYKDFCQNLADMRNEALPPEKPKYNRYTVLTDNPNRGEYVYFSPHIHVIAYGEAIPTDTWKDIMPGVVLVNHSAKKDKKYSKKKKQTPEGAVKAIAYYLLTHAPLVKNDKGTVMDLYTYGGFLHSSKLRKMKICPVCGEKNPSSSTTCKACEVPLYKMEYCNCPVCGDILIKADVINDVIHYPANESPIYKKVTEYLYTFKKAPPGILPAFRVIIEETE